MVSIAVPAPVTCDRAGGCEITQVVEIDLHRWYAVILIGGKVFGVVGHTPDGMSVYDSVDEYLRDVE